MFINSFGYGVLIRQMAAIPYVKVLEDELECPICGDVFKDPRTLDCFHKFCFGCIKDFTERRIKKEKPPCCPICKDKVCLPDGDVSLLRSSAYLNSLLQLLSDMKSNDIKEEEDLPNCASCGKKGKLVAFCPQCDGTICSQCVNKDGHQETMFTDFKKVHLNSYIRNQIRCRLHGKGKLEYFCQSCSKCICQNCSETEHKSHDQVRLGEAAEKAKQPNDRDENKMKQLKEKYLQEREVSKQNMERYGKEIGIAIRKVRDLTKAYRTIIQDHETLMIATLNSLWYDQKAANDVEQKEINTAMLFLTDFDLDGHASQDQNIAHFILQSKLELPKRNEDLLEKPSVLSWQPANRNTTVEYAPQPRDQIDQLKQLLQEVGKVVESVKEP